MVHPPLPRLVLIVFVLSFVAQRAATSFVLAQASGDPALVLGYGLQTVLGLVVVAGIWVAARWGLPAIIGLGVAFVATLFVEALYLGLRPPVVAVMQSVVAALATAGLFFIVRYEIGRAQTG